MPPTSTDSSKAVPSDPAERIAQLERKLAARDQVIRAMRARLAELDASEGTFRRAEATVALTRVVARKTLEVEAQRKELSAALEVLKRTQAQLLQSQKLEAIGELAAGVAHELNTPIQYVSDNHEFLQLSFAKLTNAVRQARVVVESVVRGQVDEAAAAAADQSYVRSKIGFLLEEVPRAFSESAEGLKRVASIVAAMKAFAHPSAGEKTFVDLREAIQTTITVATSEWRYVADVKTDFDPALPEVRCLRDEFNQVVLNLVVNAAHAIAAARESGATDKGVITVSTKRNGEWAEVRVTDTGCGIPKEVQARVFEPFFTTKPVGKGTGQGLALAYASIVENHRGEISFESKEGQGTTFIVRLPLTSSTGSDKPELAS